MGDIIHNFRSCMPLSGLIQMYTNTLKRSNHLFNNSRATFIVNNII